MFLPTPQNAPFIAQKLREKGTAHGLRRSNYYGIQSVTLLHLHYGKDLDLGLISQGAFYAMHEIFLFCAFSEVQLLNTVEQELLERKGDTFDDNHTFNPYHLIYSQELLDKIMGRCRNTINMIKTRHGIVWPKASDAKLSEKADLSALSLERDYEDILEHCCILFKRCESNVNIIINRAMIMESNKATGEAKEVSKLTRLALCAIL
ncbi:hypothetical protein M501DRAFT_997058 [Patellaria atrata CBS 101060]|uniref:Uncharacterized protein n=1 Tax=Patellaria atrata CBS 101060 TaxID=1346257 RepID=A0A9P4S5L5_9PEZI|nr:hypothetical protein M501DRAFT_997058 [Patellaria atrata CBS 101060]